MRVFVEAAGCLTANYLISAIHDADGICVASDANELSIGRYLADEFYKVPMAAEDCYAHEVFQLLAENHIDLVIPTLDDALIKWAGMREKLKNAGIKLAISDSKALEICLDKWKTYQCFVENDVPTPKTSLGQHYKLIKPRNGRGGSGISITESPIDMRGMISQELLIGTEYTVDVFCNLLHKPVYIVPRKRIGVKDGKSTGGEVVKNDEIETGIRKICGAIQLTGAVNIQCFETDKGVKFTEINPRFGGGSVLGMKATENWIPLTIDTFCNNVLVEGKKPIQYGLKMGRYYAEVFYK